MVATRCRSIIFATAFGVFVVMATGSGRVAMSQSVPATPIEFRLDSLFRSGNFPALVDSASEHLAMADIRGDSVMIGRMLTALGRGQVMMGSPDGVTNLDHSILVSRTVRDTLNWMSALGYKSLVFTYYRRYDDSIALNRARLVLAQQTGDQASEAWARTMLGYNGLLLGELDTAKTEYTAAVDLFAGLGLQRETLTPLLGLGRVYNSLREIDEARTCFQRVMETAREVGDRVNEAHAVNNLGTIEFGHGDMELAVQYFERSRDMAQESGDIRGTITPAENIALAQQYLGRFEEAARVYEPAIKLCQEAGFEDLIPSLMTRMGEARFLQQRMNASARWYRRVLASGERLDQKTHDVASYGLARSLTYLDSAQTALDVLDAGHRQPLPENRLKIHFLRSWCLLKLDRPEEALTEALRAEDATPMDEQVMSPAPARRLSECYRALGDHEAAIEWFRETLARQAVFRASKESYAWREAQGGGGHVLDGAEVILEQSGKSRAEMEAELFDVVQQFKMKTLIERITEPRRMGESGAGFSELRNLDLRSLQNDILEPGELFLDFAVGDYSGYLFAVTRDSVRLVNLPGRFTKMAGKVSMYRQIVGQLPSRHSGTGTLVAEEVERMNRSMGDAIFGGVADLVRSSSVLLISASKFYGGVPFGTLSLPGVDGRDQQLIHSHVIQMIPSASVLAWQRSREVPVSDGILAIEPVEPDDLPGAHKEVESIRRRYTGVTVRNDPGKPAIADVPPSTGIVHVAAHTEINDESPWHSGILLGERSGDFSADPYLRAGDIASARLYARLAVLSGCESAMGRPSVGEGVAGLTAAFLSAGVRSVVATLWRVDDEVTADLMARFYEGLADGMPIAAALRQAQLAIGALPESSHPFYWAGFVVVGDAGVSVDLERRPSGGLPSTLLVILLCVIIVGASLLIFNHFNKLEKSSTTV